MDFIIDRYKKPVLIEVNSIPGLSPASIIPQQVKYRGWKLSNVLSTLAEEHIA
jgi:D-alanine-D-alanine ligase